MIEIKHLPHLLCLNKSSVFLRKCWGKEKVFHHSEIRNLLSQEDTGFTQELSKGQHVNIGQLPSNSWVRSLLCHFIIFFGGNSQDCARFVGDVEMHSKITNTATVIWDFPPFYSLLFITSIIMHVIQSECVKVHICICTWFAIHSQVYLWAISCVILGKLLQGFECQCTYLWAERRDQVVFALPLTLHFHL